MTFEIVGMQTFSLKTEVVFGPDALLRLAAFRGQRVGIVTDAFMVSSGMADRIRARLSECDITVFSEVVPEPSFGDIVKGTSILAESRPEVIVALGGGSSIDAAKAITAALRALSPAQPIVFIAIPTTSGTGSEVTAYAVISEPEKGLKYPLYSDDIIPDIALLDPDLVRSVPPKVTADTGMDVITHALEAYVSVGANDFSDAFAEKALALAYSALPQAYAEGGDLAARSAMHKASCLAGLAFNTAGLGLNHGLAHALGGKLHISHGRINAMLLPLVIEYNAGIDGESAIGFRSTALRYADIARHLGLEHETPRFATKALVQAVVELNERLGIPSTLKEMGLPVSRWKAFEDDLVKAALADACTASNPRKPTEEDVVALIRAVAGDQ